MERIAIYELISIGNQKWFAIWRPKCALTQNLESVWYSRQTNTNSSLNIPNFLSPRMSFPQQNTFTNFLVRNHLRDNSIVYLVVQSKKSPRGDQQTVVGHSEQCNSVRRNVITSKIWICLEPFTTAASILQKDTLLIAGVWKVWVPSIGVPTQIIVLGLNWMREDRQQLRHYNQLEFSLIIFQSLDLHSCDRIDETFQR